MPCDGNLEVEVKLRDGFVTSIRSAWSLSWTNAKCDADIIAWRPAKPAAQPEPTIKESLTVQADPKALHAEKKPQMQLIPPTFDEQLSRALECGAAKYGAWNWRENKVEAMTYIGAMKRHIAAFVSGEECAPDSGVHHLAHVAASSRIAASLSTTDQRSHDLPEILPRREHCASGGV